MKTLLLMRHGKTGPKLLKQEDFDRPLAPRGHEDAARISGYLESHNLGPALVLCSTARRAEESWSCIAPNLTADAALMPVERLYLASPADLLGAIRQAPATASPLLVVGHNPGMEAIARGLAGPGSAPDALERLHAGYPSCGLAVLDFDIEDWADAGPGKGRLRAFVTPKVLG